MIKRVISCLSICLIITGLISPVISDASALPQPNWNDPGISEIINISDLTGWMLNGGTYDVSTYTDAESFMNDYYAGRTSTKLVDGNDLYYNQFGIGQDLYNIGAKNFSNRLDTNRMISSSFREHSGYGRRFSVQANESLLNTGSLYDMKIPLLNEVEFANFVGYNYDALNIYKSGFLGDFVQPDPDPSYSNYLSIINGTEVQSNYQYNFLRNSTVRSNFWPYVPEGVDFLVGNKTYYSCDYGGSNFINNPLSSQITFYNTVLTANVDTSTLSYSVTPSTDYWYPCSSSNNSNTKYNTCIGVSYNSNINGFECGWWKTGPDAGYQYNFSGFNNLNQLFNNMAARWHNINIYVDNVPWSILDTPDPNVPEFPDVVGGEDLPATTWPIFRPRAPYYTSVPGMLQAIEDAIADDGKLDIDDLKPYLTDENGDPVPDPIFDPEPVPIPVPDPVNPDVVPGLPELPVIPLNMPGYNGVSVLAEIINFTNQSLPTSLIVTFWGIVFGIVILGLIKILHK